MNVEKETFEANKEQAETENPPLSLPESEAQLPELGANPELAVNNVANAFVATEAKTEQTIQHPWLLLLVALVLAVGADLLIYGQNLGKQFAIVVNAIMLGAVILSWVEKRKVPWQSWPLMAMVSASSILTVFRSEPFTTAALVIFVGLGLPVLLASLLSGQWVVYRLREYIKRYLILGVHSLIGLPRTLFDMGKNRKQKQGAKKHLQTIGAVLLGLLLAVPLLLLFGKLLSSADSHFASRIQVFLNFFMFEKAENFWPQFFFVLVLFWGFAGVLYYILTQSFSTETTEPDKPLVPPFLSNIAAMVTLGLVNLLFLVFIVGQWGYFFGGSANIVSTGFTYSKYATKGFTELMVAASLAAIVHYLFASITKRETKAEKVGFSVVATLLLVLVWLMLVSSFQRLLLYETAYGFTRSRLVAHVFMIFLGVLLVALAVMEMTKSLKRLGVVLLLSVFLFGITLTAVNVDKTIARLNIDRALHATSIKKGLDGAYLFEKLSADASLEVYANYANLKLPADLRDDLGKVLACRALKAEGTAKKLGQWHTYRVPTKAEADFFEQHRESLLEKYPPIKEDCGLSYQINGEPVTCIDRCSGYFGD